VNLRLSFALKVALALAVLLAGMRAAFAEHFTLDATSSDALTHHLHHKRLPLVGAQVLSGDDGTRKVILYGYVATDKGRYDAEQRARSYLGGGDLEVDNRVVVEPSVRRAHPPATENDYGSMPPPVGAPSPQTFGAAPFGGPYPTPLPTIVPNMFFP
jgi:hypothetical protein